MTHLFKTFYLKGNLYKPKEYIVAEMIDNSHSLIDYSKQSLENIDDFLNALDENTYPTNKFCLETGCCCFGIYHILEMIRLSKNSAGHKLLIAGKSIINDMSSWHMDQYNYAETSANLIAQIGVGIIPDELNRLDEAYLIIFEKEKGLNYVGLNAPQIKVHNNKEENVKFTRW